MKKIFLLCLALFMLTISAYGDEIKNTLQFDNNQETQISDNKLKESTVDWGPYMREVHRKLKLNWNPPKGKESKRVVMLFKVARDGHLLSIKTVKSSGSSDCDLAAKKAIEISAPFKPFPKEYKDNAVDIEFTFDYNVVGGKKGKSTNSILDNYIDRYKESIKQE